MANGKKTGGITEFSAVVQIECMKTAVFEENYNKTEMVESGFNRNIVDIRLTAPTLEQLQEKIIAHVKLAE